MVYCDGANTVLETIKNVNLEPDFLGLVKLNIKPKDINSKIAIQDEYKNIYPLTALFVTKLNEFYNGDIKHNLNYKLEDKGNFNVLIAVESPNSKYKEISITDIKTITSDGVLVEENVSDNKITENNSSFYEGRKFNKIIKIPKNVVEFNLNVLYEDGFKDKINVKNKNIYYR